MVQTGDVLLYDVVEYVQASTSTNAKQWLFALMEELPHTTMIKLVVTLCAIWAARRKAIHDGILQSPHATHYFFFNFY